MDSSPEYEFPLNEFIRNALKVDRLLDHFKSKNCIESELSLRNTLSRLLELHTLLCRPELKHELIKELDKKIKRLSCMTSAENVDRAILEDIIQQLDKALQSVKVISPDVYSKPLPYVMDSIKQRDKIPGGQFDPDLPVYKCWLSSDPDSCYQQALGCISGYQAITQAISAYMQLLRMSSPYREYSARNGFLQLEENENTELLVIRINTEARIYPVISGGRQRVFVRFMELISIEEKPLQTEKDVSFELKSCFI